MRDALNILVVDDEPDICHVLEETLTGNRITTAHSGSDALRLLRGERFEVLLLDLRMPGMSGLEVLKVLKAEGVGTEVVILTAHGDVKSAVTAMKLGAHDYLQKPFDLTDIEQIVLRAAECYRQKLPRGASRPMNGDETPLAPVFLGVDPKILALRTIVEQVAPAAATVLITGETGTGKELVAGMIHARSPRAARSFTVVDCPSVPASLFESEVFGHERGAYTGAVASRRGRLEEADGGTLFLDEVGELPLEVQVKLLRFLQERRVRPVGGNRTVSVDARVISATNRDLTAMVSQGTFRADLYHRLNVIQIDIPPLRERKGDLPLLVAHFVERLCRRAGVPRKVVSAECHRSLAAYDWPGNVRELENVIHQACILTRGDSIGADSLPPRVLRGVEADDGGGPSRAQSRADRDRQHILGVLHQERWNISRAARVLGVHRTTLYRKFVTLGIERGALGDKVSN
jgi:DNA-binding NtrC family response regulator